MAPCLGVELFLILWGIPNASHGNPRGATPDRGATWAGGIGRGQTAYLIRISSWYSKSEFTAQTS